MIDIFKIKTAIICNNDFAKDNLHKTFDFFVSRGFDRFIFLYEFDFELSSVAEANLRMKNINDKINQAKPKGVSVKLDYKFIFSDDLRENLYLSSMISKKDRFIYVQIPLFYDGIMTSDTLNYLLYKEKLLPIFIDFNKNIITCDDEFLENQVFRSTAGIFTFDFNFLISGSDSGIKWVYEALKKGIKIFPCFSGDIFNYAGLDKVLYNCDAHKINQSTLDLYRQIKRTEKLLF